MTNRHQRRAEAKAPVIETPQVDNLSGTDQACGNCGFAVTRAQHDKTIAAIAAFELKHGRPAPQKLPPDETVCLEGPQERGKKTWGWGSKWQARA